MGKELQRGSVLNERYRIDGLFAHGGMSQVYLARDKRNGSLVAVKTDAKREAEMLSKLHHRGIVRMIDFFTEGGRTFLVEEYLKGINLKELVSRKGPLDPETVSELSLQILDILNYLHVRNPPVVYLDLKPDNMILMNHSDLKLVDFGIARRYLPGARKSGSGFGTPGYAAPEQFAGSRWQSGPRSDIYSFGKLMYFLLTGDDPEEDRRLQDAAFFRECVISRIEDSFLAGVILKCTEPDPENRYADVKTLEYVLSKRKADVSPLLFEEPEKKAPGETEKNRTHPLAVLLLLLSVFIYAGGFLFGLGMAYIQTGALHLAQAILWWMASLVLGTIVLAMSRILKLLYEIRSRL